MGILLTIAYDGTDYCGWQIQKNGVAVQEVLENAVDELFGPDFSLLGASRTDAGVHALGQRAHLMTKNPCKIPLEKLPLALNSCLPADVRVLAAEDVEDSFHPIIDTKSKIYTYKINNTKHHNPLLRRYTAFAPATLDTCEMSRAAAHFVGEFDFAAFCAGGSSVKSTVRRVFAVSIAREGQTVDITIQGNGFLYNMVRIMAGTLVEVGMGRLTADDLPAIIASKDRRRAGKTMPPQGLTLIEIFY